MKYDIESLNEQQKNALLCTEGVVLVTAGAGSGKTRLLTHRICYLIEEKHVQPRNILAITFTNKATNEMKERVAQMGHSNVWISTFHSMCVRILRKDIHHIDGYSTNFTIIDENDREKVLKKLLKKYNIDDDECKKDLKKHIENIKGKGFDAGEYFDALRDNKQIRNVTVFQNIFEEYEEYLHKNNSLDFDDLLTVTLFLFNNYPKVLKEYATRFEYVLVDEFQDTNLVQYKLVKMLCSVHKNLFVVGDEDQCIYSWRGANFQNIFNLRKDFPDLHVFKLEQNYRSCKNILTLANNVIQNNRERMAKNLWTDKSDGAGPVVFQAFDERDEANFVARTIQEMCQNGADFSDFAVLMRVNALSRSFEETFMAYQIPYKLYGGFKFYERAEIRIALAYLAIFINPRDEISLMKAICFPKRGIGDVAISNLQQEAGGQFMLEYLCSERFKFSKYHSKLKDFVQTYLDLKEKMDKMSMYDFCKRVFTHFGLYAQFSGRDEESLSKRANLDSLLSGIEEYQNENADGTLSEYLSEVMLKSDSDNIQEEGYVTISTIHSVKGLEFPVVFVIGLEETIFPLSRASLSNTEMEEERRLMYVAITRAEERIFLSYAAKRFMYGRTSVQSPSRFLSELGIVERSQKVLSAAKKEKKKDLDVFDSGFLIGDKIFHARYGQGLIVDISEDGYVAEIDFEDFGRKSLMLNIAKIERMEEDDE